MINIGGMIRKLVYSVNKILWARFFFNRMKVKNLPEAKLSDLYSNSLISKWQLFLYCIHLHTGSDPSLASLGIRILLISITNNNTVFVCAARDTEAWS